MNKDIANNDSGNPLQYIPGDVLENLTVQDLAVDGKAVARHEGRVVFLDSGLPGECVTARITDVGKRVIHAQVECSLSPSPHAVMPWCPHVAECGACLWQHFSPQAACEWKQKHIRETLSRIGKVREPIVYPPIPSPQYREYRNKMTYAFAVDTIDGTEKTALGLRRFKDRAVVEVTHCGLQPPKVMELLSYTRQAVSELGLEAWQTGGAGYLRFFCGSYATLYARRQSSNSGGVYNQRKSPLEKSGSGIG